MITSPSESEARYRLMVDNALEGICLLDAELHTASANQRAAEMLGCQVEELIGRPIADYCVAEERENLRRRAERWRQGQSEHFETHCPRTGGGALWVQVVVRPLADEHKNFAGVLLLLLDVTERRLAEQALRSSEARLAYLLEHNPAVIYSCSPAPPYEPTFLSTNTREVLGYEPGEFKAYKEFWIDHIHPDDRKDLFAGAEQFFATGRHMIEYRFRQRDGSYRWLQDRMRLARDARGQPVEIIGTAMDITAQKVVEERLRASEVRYRRMVDTATEGVWLLDGEFRTAYVNQRVTEMLGYSPDELTGRPATDFIFPEDLAEGMRVMEAGRRGVGARKDRRLRRKDGTELWVLLSASPIMDEAGHFLGGLCMLTDITARKRVEEEKARLFERERHARELAEAAQRRLTLLAEASRILAQFLDHHVMLDQVAHLVVPGFADLCIVALEEDGTIRREASATSGPPLEDLGHDEDAGYDPGHPIQRAIREQRLIHVAEMSPDQLTRWSSASPELARTGARTAIATPLRARGHTLGALLLARMKRGRRFDDSDLTLAEDLAGRIALALDNTRLYHELERSDRNKAQFLALLGHELRNPLAPILNAVEILERVRPDDPRGARAIATIRRQAQHESSLVDDLLNITRIARGKLLLRMEPVELGALVRHVADDHRQAIEAAQLVATLELPREPLFVRGDPTRIAQITGNLLTNAIKFTDPGGRIAIQVTPSEDGAWVRVSVRDTGIGMAPELVPRLFEPFTQAESTKGRSRGGLGLGLALSRGLVELHGGTIQVQSAGPGRGTEVWFTLPRSMPEQETAAAAATIRSHRRILVIEDNRDAAEMLRELLELEGNEVEVTFTGGDGIRAALEYHPDVVLCDLGLPDMSGLDVARRLRGEPSLSEAKLVAVSGFGQLEDLRRSREAGFDAHLVKPVRYEELAQIFEEPRPAP